MPKSDKVTVFFDGLCPLCSREINHYRSARGADRLSFIDITDSAFDAAKEGVDPHQVHKVMHVRGSDGQIYTGVDAFVHIWQNLPGYVWLARVLSFAPLYRLAGLGYCGFAAIRPFLPRKSQTACSESPYCETPKS